MFCEERVSAHSESRICEKILSTNEQESERQCVINMRKKERNKKRAHCGWAIRHTETILSNGGYNFLLMRYMVWHSPSPCHNNWCCRWLLRTKIYVNLLAIPLTMHMLTHSLLYCVFDSKSCFFARLHIYHPVFVTLLWSRRYHRFLSFFFYWF